METLYRINHDNGLVEIGTPERVGFIRDLFERAREGKPITVGFLGGSITQGCVASEDSLGYAHLVYQWFVRKFPGSDIKYVNAGIGATDSEYAAARVKEDLLDAKPDFVLMEFAVNDGCTDHYLETYEGTLRQILNSKPDIAVMLMCNVFYDEGRNSERIHRQIARHYGIPVVSMRTTIYDAILRGEISDNRDITPDDLHPNDAGHQLVADVITAYLEKLSDTAASGDSVIDGTNAGSLADAGLPEALTKNRYEKSIKYDNRNSGEVLKGMQGFTADGSPRKAVKDCFRYGYSAAKAGNFAEYEVEGACIAVQFRRTINLPAPIAKVIVDGDEASSVILDANFDETWGDLLALTDVYMSDRVSVHTVRVEVIEAHPDDKGDFYLAGIIVSG